ncbi:MAG: hypothetical protein WCF77_05025, partial [Minisyncoccia bacterium]
MAPSKKKVVAVSRKKRTIRKPRVVRGSKKVASRPKRSPAPVRKRLRKKVVVRRPVVASRPRFAAIQKHEANPIIEPRPENFWEMKATFNPAAVRTDGRVYLLYRAIGGDDTSKLGFAVSDDGVTIAERSAMSVFEHRTKGAEPLTTVPKIDYLSGGGSAGGSEDPRLTFMKEDGRIYLTYTAFDGWGSVRLALSSIAKDDFVNQRWRWTDPVFLSPPGEIHKNWVLFPEKINGKFAILHSISPEILIDYVDDLSEFEDEERNIKSHYNRHSGAAGWDSWVRGAGPPPIRTRLGWLLFYHAMDVRDPNRYKLGAMVLDANDPTKILYRSRVPILEPEEWYENSGWKSGVVYSCGAVIKDGELYVYYGGADSVVCVAVADLDRFLDELVLHGSPRL